MKRSFLIAGIAATATAVSAASVLAMGPGRGHMEERPSFQELDLDGNGEVTREEMQQHRQVRFEQADTDKDGKLSAAEMEAQAQSRVKDRVARMIGQLDKDGDGALSQAELPQRRMPDRMFQRLDDDGNGGISEEEFAQAGDRMRGHRKHKREHGMKHGDGKKRNGSTQTD